MTGVQTCALPICSRTSVQLARVILERRFGASPDTVPHVPDLPAMLRIADAALIIGDPALRVEPAELTYGGSPLQLLDLGGEWVEWSGLPMVFAVWAGRKEALTSEAASAFRASHQWGREHVDEMVEHAAAERGFRKELAREYFTKFIVYPLTARHLEGLALFRKLVLAMDTATAAV